MDNNVIQAVSANGIGVLLLVTTLLNFYRKYRSRSVEQKVFAAMLFANLSQCIVEGATFLVDGQRFPGAVTVATVLNASVFANNIVYSYLWTIYADLRVNGSTTIRRVILRGIPALLILAGSVINLFTPVFFSISPENVYERTSLFTFDFILTYAYLLMGTLTAYRSRKKGDRYVILPAFTFLMPVVLGSIVQFFCKGISLMWVGAAIGMNYAYISLVDESASVDPLSGAFSRHQLNQELHTLRRQVSDGHKMAGLMLDIDDFKSINDRYGHLVGDDAIREVGNMLRRAARGYGKVYRYAGDEFAILLPLAEGDEAEDVVARIREELTAVNTSARMPCRLGLSIGLAVYEPGEPSSEFIRRMDAAMYQDKNSH